MILNNDIPNLIYTNKAKEEQGVIQGYELDLAYGSDENSFELSLPRENKYNIQTGALIYAEGTEYGGIIDAFSIDSINNKIIYSGRTWQGILAGKVVIPEANQDYFTIHEKNGNEAIREILANIGENGIDETDTPLIDEDGFTILTGWVLTQRTRPGGEIVDEPNLEITFFHKNGNYYNDNKMPTNGTGKNRTSIINNVVYLYEYRGTSDVEPYGIQYTKSYSYQINDDVFFYPSLEADAIIDSRMLNYDIRYMDAYSAILNMLFEQNMKLQIEFPCEINGQSVMACKLSAKASINYADDEEWNLKNQLFKAKRADNRVNHIVALGQGDLRDRFVLNVYADEYGGAIYTDGEKFIADTERLYSGFRDGQYKILGDFKDVTRPLVGTVEKAMLLKYVPTGKIVALWKDNLYDTTHETFPDNEYLFTDADGVEHSIIEDVPEIGYTRATLPMVYDCQYPISIADINGIDEYAEVLDLSSAEFREIYLSLIYQPYDYATNYKNYYYLDADTGDYYNIEPITDYVLQSAQPSDWLTNYANYYEMSNGSYNSVSSVSNPVPTYIASQPSDWLYNYADYKYKYTDGVNIEYRAINGAEVKAYKLQTQKPTDWNDNYNSYFYYGVGYEPNQNKTWKKGKYYKFENNKYTKLNSKPSDWKQSYNSYYEKTSDYHHVEPVKKKAPSWSANKYYTYMTVQTVAPSFVEYQSKYGVYRVGSTAGAPSWQTNKYFSLKETRPPFRVGEYYEKIVNHYATLYESAIEKLQAYANSDKIEMELSPDYNYDVSDIVGCTDDATGLSIIQPITKKIVELKDYKKTITYEIGGLN